MASTKPTPAMRPRPADVDQFVAAAGDQPQQSAAKKPAARKAAAKQRGGGRGTGRVYAAKKTTKKAAAKRTPEEPYLRADGVEIERRTIWLPVELAAQLDKRAADTGRKVSDIAARALQLGLQQGAA